MFSALQLAAAEPTDALVEKLLDRIVERENVFLAAIASRTPLAETYIQETPEGSDVSARPTKDHYFLGRVRWNGVVDYQPLVAPDRRTAGEIWFLAALPFGNREEPRAHVSTTRFRADGGARPPRFQPQDLSL